MEIKNDFAYLNSEFESLYLHSKQGHNTVTFCND
jgi:hypothetical protein